MSFVDFFRPKWKHSDPEVRAEAVRDLENESQLVQVLKGDDDARVRKIALKKIADADVLAEVAESDGDEGLRRAAAEKASEIFLARALADDEAKAQAGLKRLSHPRTIAEIAKTAALEPVRHAALARLSDDKNLADVAKNAKDPAMRRAAIERIHDSQALRDIAIAEALREVGIAAVEQIQETAVLEQVAKRAKNKQVAQAARDRLPQAMGRVERTTRPPQEVPPEARRRARQVQLVREMEHAVSKPELSDAEHAVAEVKHAWAELGTQAGDEEQQKKFDKVLERFTIRKRTLEDAARAHHDAEVAAHKKAEEDKAQAEAREALCVKVEALDGAIDAIKAAVEAARREWQEMPRMTGGGGPKGKELEIRFRKATESAIRRAELSLSKVKLREKMDALVAEAEALTGPLKEVEPKVRALRKKLADLEAAGFDEELRARFRKVEERVEAQKAELVAKRAAEDQEAQKRLEDQVARLEALGDDADRKKVEQELKVVASAFESTKLRGPALQTVRDRYNAIRDKLAARAQELREAENWKRWANVPQLEKLCGQMEAIARALAAEQHPNVKAEATTEAAEATSEAAEATIEATEAKQETAEAKQETAEAKQETAEAKQETAEAKTEGAEAKAPEAEASEAAEEAKQPAGAPPIFGKKGKVDFKKAMAFMKVLQAEWKTVGPAPKERSEQLWQRFKIAGDEVYHRTHTAFEKLGESRAENVKKKEELIAQVEALVAPFAAGGEKPEGEAAATGPSQAEWKETAEKIKALQEEWKKSGPVSRADNDALWKRFRGACDQFFGKRKEVGSSRVDLQACKLEYSIVSPK